MMVGTDIEAICEALITGGVPYFFIAPPGCPGHVALEDLPPEDQLLFHYDPELAIQMLADAGYPDGFATSISAGSAAGDTEMAEMLEYMWGLIGVDLTINTYETAVQRSRMVAQIHDPVGTTAGVATVSWTNIESIFMSTGRESIAMYDNPVVEELWYEGQREMDEAKRAEILEEIFVILTHDVPYIPLGTSVGGTGQFWWPWVKNYYGELEEGGGHISPPWDLMWIDQDLKAEMGY